MYLIKRTKAAPPGPMDAITGSAPPAVHWATGINPEGVVGWTRDREQAGRFEMALAHGTVLLYADRPAAGRMELEEEEAAAPPPAAPAAPRPNEDDLRNAVAEIGRLRGVIEAQHAEIEQLRRDLAEAAAPAGAVNAAELKRTKGHKARPTDAE